MAKFVYKNTCHQWQTVNHKVFKQNAVDYQSHLTIENNLKIEKRYIILKTSTMFPTPRKKRMGYA